MTPSQVIGENLSRIRHEHGFTLDQISAYARSFGLRWNTARVSRIARGEGAMTLDTAMMLAVILTEMVAEEISVESLLVSAEPIEIAPGATVRPESVALLVASGRRSVERPDDLRDVLYQGAQHVAENERMHDQVIDAAREILEPVDEYRDAREVYFSSLSQVTLSDERNAHKLGLTVPELCAWSARFWGRIFSQEVEARTPEDATAQKKGHITRELMMEFRIRMKMTNGVD